MTTKRLGVGTMVWVVLAGCGPRDVDLGGKGGRPGDVGIPPEAGGTYGYGGVSGSAGTTAGGAYATGGSSGGALSCWDDRVLTGACYPQEMLVEFGLENCVNQAAELRGLSFEGGCDDPGEAFGVTVTCCREGGAGGTGGAGGEPTTGGSSYGGTYAGSSYGGTGEPVGGTGAGGSYGGSISVGGTGIGGSIAGTGGSIPTGGTAGSSGEQCWSTSIDSETCADNDVFLGRGYERCEQAAGALTSIAYTVRCDAYTSLSADVTCCLRGGGAGGSAGASFGGTAGIPAGGTYAGGASSN